MSMRRPRHNMGRADWIGIEALGVPGQRTFRLLIQAGEQSAQLWLEKEQLQALADAITRMLAEIDNEQGLDVLSSTSTAPPSPKPADFPATPEIELFVGALGLRYDPQRKHVALDVYDRDSTGDEPPTLRCVATREQLEALQQSSVEVIASGRPRCPLCGTPLPSPGFPHFCPPTNGHQKVTPGEE